MTNHIYELELGFESPSRLRTISAKQYDQQSRYINIHFSDGLEEYTLNQNMIVYLKAKKPDGNYVYRDSTLKAKDPAGNTINELVGDIAIDTTNNMIVIELTEQMLAAPGIVHCEIVLQEDKQILTSDYFDIKVLPSVLPIEALKSETDYSSLSNAVEKLSILDMEQVQNSLDNLDTIINATERSEAGANTAVKKAKEAGNYAAAAKTSEEKSKVYENNALSYMNTSSVCAFNAKESQTNAKISELNSKQNEENAFNHMNTASICAYNAKQSQINAKESETNSKKFKDDAFQYMSTASVCAFNTKESEINSKNSELNSKQSEIESKNSELNSLNNATTASICAFNAKQSKIESKNSEIESKKSENNAFEYMNTSSICAFNAKESQANANESERNALNYAKEAESFTHGGTDTRTNEDFDNAENYYKLSKNYKETSEELLNKATDLLEEASRKIIDVSFDINWETGELEYESETYEFEINDETGELEWSVIQNG